LATQLNVASFNRKKECENRKVEKANWAKGEIWLNGKQFKLKFKKVFIKGWTNHGVWKLMNAGNVQWESWWKRVRKERNYHSVQTLTAGMQRFIWSKERKNKTTSMNVWSTMARSDWMTRGIQPENRTAPNFKSDYALIRMVSLWKEWWSSIAREKGAKPDKNLLDYVRKKLVYMS
jgi:hypothetical protein